MKEKEVWILGALAETPCHGYALMERVREMSQGAVSLGPATLYRTLDGLAERKLIEALPEERTGERPRQPWAITKLGRSTLSRQVEILEAASERLRSAMNASQP